MAKQKDTTDALAAITASPRRQFIVTSLGNGPLNKETLYRKISELIVQDEAPLLLGHIEIAFDILEKKSVISEESGKYYQKILKEYLKDNPEVLCSKKSYNWHLRELQEYGIIKVNDEVELTELGQAILSGLKKVESV